MFWAPWVGHYFPGITPNMMSEIDTGQFIDMWKSVDG